MALRAGKHTWDVHPPRPRLPSTVYPVQLWTPSRARHGAQGGRVGGAGVPQVAQLPGEGAEARADGVPLLGQARGLLTVEPPQLLPEVVAHEAVEEGVDGAVGEAQAE